MNQSISLKLNSNLKERILRESVQFHLYVLSVIDDSETTILLDNEENPEVIALFHHPAVLLYGNGLHPFHDVILRQIENHTYIVCEDYSWELFLKERYQNQLTHYPRMLFESSLLSVQHLLSMKKELPDGFQILPLTQASLESDTMIIDDLIDRFYSGSPFLKNGFGFGLYYHSTMIGFIAPNYPIVSNEVEVYVRVDYNSDPSHRHQGFGHQLAICFLVECLKRKLTPIWDSANEISSKLAKKLGFIPMRDWNMYYLNMSDEDK